MQERLDRQPEMMRVRRQTVEHPFGTIKHWMGSAGRGTETYDGPVKPLRSRSVDHGGRIPIALNRGSLLRFTEISPKFTDCANEFSRNQ
jgi:hypothetical protein